MDKPDKVVKTATPDKIADNEDSASSSSKSRSRARKRKRCDSETSSDLDDILPENAMEVEKNLQSAALKNNLDDVSVKKILKKVVTNDHVLALVKLREEEEIALCQEENPKPKLTRAKAKELMKVSPKSAPWNLELTPIKHIPVKTRPEVEALISKELPEDEDDEEYEPTHEDAPSDDDQTLESCSDVDSLPATPGARPPASPAAPVQDGPFKVPQGMLTPSRKKIVIVEEEATIALRTRSKLSLSETPIEHIESSFVPPDDVPMPIKDDLWDQFLEQCLNPAEASKNEDDDEADPEYNVAADPDAHDEDEETNMIRISKKELNDLVTELFSILPEDSANEELAENLANNVLKDNGNAIPNGTWEGKRDALTEEENRKQSQKQTESEQQKRDSVITFSVGKKGMEDPTETENQGTSDKENNNDQPGVRTRSSYSGKGKKGQKAINIEMEEEDIEVVPAMSEPPPPPLLRTMRAQHKDTAELTLSIDGNVKMLPEQILILQQQLRQHIQLATSNYLQLYVNPAHWKLAPNYKEYLEQFHKMVESNPKSVVNVCNLQPALELANSWEVSVCEDTPQNKEMVEFVQSEAERSRRRFHKHHLYIGNFPELFMKTVANSTVFQYPYLLPAMPYRADYNKKFGYRRSEDELVALGLDQYWEYVESNPDMFKRPRNFAQGRWGLVATCNMLCKYMFPWMSTKWLLSHTGGLRLIALGLDQFWEYVESNPDMFKRPRNFAQGRWGLVATCNMLCKYMFPWMSTKWLQSHVVSFRKKKDNPIGKFFLNREVTRVEHKLYPFNPQLTLYEQPEYEMPRLWLRYLAKTSKRFKYYMYKRQGTGTPPQGVPVTVGVEEPVKKPLPADFTKEIKCYRMNIKPKVPEMPSQDKFDMVVVPKPKGPILTINPISSTNINDIISSGNQAEYEISSTAVQNVPEVIVPAGKVAIPSITAINKIANPPNKPVMATLTPVAFSKLIPQATVVNAAENDNMQTPQTLPNETSKPQNEHRIISNMYSVVNTSLGSYLVPLTVLQNTNTVNSITAPISSTSIEDDTEENLPESSDFPEPSKTTFNVRKVTRTAEDLKYHCQCCKLLKKICKEKQARITDFFKPKKKEETLCECTHRKFPKISRRLRILVDNFKSRSWCEQRRIKSLLESKEKVRSNKKDEERLMCEEDRDVECNLGDIEYVSAYHMKLTRRSTISKNIYLKTRINLIFSKFDRDDGDPILLAKELFQVFDVELIDLYKEFMGFLTPEQADQIDMFKDHFVHTCIGELARKIETEVQDSAKKESILNYLNGIFTDNASSACELCTGILNNLIEYPRLAKYVFSLFPHRVVAKVNESFEDKEETVTKSPAKPNSPAKSQSEQSEHLEPDEEEITRVSQIDLETTIIRERLENAEVCEETLVVMDYDDENSGSGNRDDEESDKPEIEKPDECNNEEQKEAPIENSENTTATQEEEIAEIKTEDPIEDIIADELAIEETIVAKTEILDTSESTAMSPLVMSEDEPEIQVKTEPEGWTKLEDKYILELLVKHVTPDATKTMTVAEIFEADSVYQKICDRFPYKTIDDVKLRVGRILDFLILTMPQSLN